MEEKRKYQRTEINEPGYVSSGGSVMHCVVVNISPEGAAIDVENPAFVPQRFRLVMANDSSIVHECRVAWIKQKRVGLTFIATAQSCSFTGISATSRASWPGCRFGPCGRQARLERLIPSARWSVRTSAATFRE
jgi:hypothetical protein